MSEERLNLIKENVYTRCSIANITGIGMTAPDKEELELLEEIERLKQDNEYLNKVKIELSSRNSKAMKYINEKENNDDNWIDYELLIEPIVLIDILRGSDKD